MQNTRMRRALWLLIVLTIPAQARTFHHRTPQLAAATCDAAISAAERTSRVPPGLLHAIALVESGRPVPRTGAVHPWPWTINVAGQGFFFPSKSAAIQAVEQLQAAGIRSIDVGCMQINLSYHPAAFRSLSQAFDPTANARYAAAFLTALYDRTQDWTKAAGDYHSQTPTLAGPYELRVLAHWSAPVGTVRRYAAFARPSQIYQGFLTWEQLARQARASQSPYFDARQKAYEAAP